jgi:outer membrane immunogenic protein
MHRTASAFITGAALSVALGQIALAADLPRRPAYMPPVVVAPIYNWTGCYVGGNVGAAWGRAEFTNNGNFASGSGTNSGFAGGAQIGCDYQAGQFVVGVRNMFDGTSLNSGTTFTNGYTANGKTQWFDTLTARAGYLVQPNVLLYGQGGAAWTRSDQYINNPAGAQVAQFGNNRGGWTVGGGAEWMFAPHWSTFLEYNYLNFGTNTGTWTDNVRCPAGCSVSLKRDSQNVLVGLNYKF